MARFKASNRYAKTQILRAHARAARRANSSDHKTAYFQRIGYDCAML